LHKKGSKGRIAEHQEAPHTGTVSAADKPVGGLRQNVVGLSALVGVDGAHASVGTASRSGDACGAGRGRLRDPHSAINTFEALRIAANRRVISCSRYPAQCTDRCRRRRRKSQFSWILSVQERPPATFRAPLFRTRKSTHFHA
jgi:hypothetical protein